MIQYIIVGIIVLVAVALVARSIYKMFFPEENTGSGCSGCNACSTKR